MVMYCMQNGWTALYAAANSNNEDVVNMLLMKDSTLTQKYTEVSEQFVTTVHLVQCCKAIDDSVEIVTQ